MNWITNYVRPKINSLFSRREVPENLWTKCGECGTMLFHRELADNLNVCTNCDHQVAADMPCQNPGHEPDQQNRHQHPCKEEMHDAPGRQTVVGLSLIHI